MKNFKTLQLSNTYSDNEIAVGFQILNSAGIQTTFNDENIVLDFDVVDMKYIEKQQNKTKELLTNVLDELLKIRSFSSSNGKIVFKSFNKDKKVIGKKENKEKRLGYESFQRHFSEKNNDTPSRFLNKIHCVDSLVLLKQFPDNCIDLIVTSPPYNFGINYNNSNDVNLWDNYFEMLFNIFGECVRILKSGGRMIVNIQPLFSDYVPSHHLVSNFFIRQGLIWKGEIIWEKNNYNCKYCTWGSWQSPSSPYLKYSWEFIEIFCKNTLKKDGIKDDVDITADEFKKWVYAKWSIAPERKMKEYKHDAMFPEELVKRIIKLFSYQNNIVLDPFNGAGTTTKVARSLGRQFIGIDIDQSYCEIAENRLRETNSLFAQGEN
ncbi:MAG: site-specific DNA-methyltransferase [Planctomycetaceae bacterium]|jgi:DNA modification methylase|nr:site-specific DNA-methyltransferase [Planctomycetaceae bacterium]